MHILWDIDGTLIMNAPAGGTLYFDTVAHVAGAPLQHNIANPHGMTEGQLLSELITLNGHDLTILDDALSELEVRALAEYESGFIRKPVVGGFDALRKVEGQGWVNALLTGNGPLRSRYKVTAAGYTVDDFNWEKSFFGDRSPDRHHLTSLVAPVLGDEPSVIVGDTPNDGLAADSAGIPFIAVATGAYSVADLRETSARVVVDNLVNGLDDVLGTIDEINTRG